jgi:hypothetical protein
LSALIRKYLALKQWILKLDTLEVEHTTFIMKILILPAFCPRMSSGLPYFQIRDEGREISVHGGGGFPMTPSLNSEKIKLLILSSLVYFTFLSFCQGATSTLMASQ